MGVEQGHGRNNEIQGGESHLINTCLIMCTSWVMNWNKGDRCVMDNAKKEAEMVYLHNESSVLNMVSLSFCAFGVHLTLVQGEDKPNDNLNTSEIIYH